MYQAACAGRGATGSSATPLRVTVTSSRVVPAASSVSASHRGSITLFVAVKTIDDLQSVERPKQQEHLVGQVAQRVADRSESTRRGPCWAPAGGRSSNGSRMTVSNPSSANA